MLSKVRKRDGLVADFDPSRIEEAIFKAAQSVGGSDRARAKELTQKVVDLLTKKFDVELPSVEDVQDAVERVLIQEGHAATAKAYILYRQKRSELREARKAILGKESDVKLSQNGLLLLRERFLLKNESNEVVETPDSMFWRVARAVAHVDTLYDPQADVDQTTLYFHDMMARLDFLPDPIMLSNAGTPSPQLLSRFVLPVEDSMENVFETLKHVLLIQQAGGRVVLDFSRLRPKGDSITSTHGSAAGPLDFLKVYDAAVEAIKSGGRFAGVHEAVLRVDHPDVLEFITLAHANALTNFRLNLLVTPAFWKALNQNEDYEVIHPSGKTDGSLDAHYVFDVFIATAWKTGEPGLIFCKDGEGLPFAETVLSPYESCASGTINLPNFFKDGDLDWERLKTLVMHAVHFLDNVFDISRYPLHAIEEATRATRKISLGVMGFADLLQLLRIPYDSPEAEAFAEKLASFISHHANQSSQKLAEKRGVFSTCLPNLNFRNATRTGISDSDSLAQLADCSLGVDPPSDLRDNPRFEQEAKLRGFYHLLPRVVDVGSCRSIDEVPEDVRHVYATNQDILPDWQLRVSAVFQKHCDGAVAKTIRLPRTATLKDVDSVFKSAGRLGFKSLRVVRSIVKPLRIETQKQVAQTIG